MFTISTLSRISGSLGAVSVLATAASAQWATDAALNFALGDNSSDQNQPLVAPTPDGGAWISWFDGIGSGWDVRVQKVDVNGNEVFAHNGILVADRGFSSTQGYGLDTDAMGNALLTFRDDSVGGTQITAAKVTTAGALAWGPTGIQLTSTTNFVANPKITGTSDGGAFVAWIENANVLLQKLDSSGAAQLAPAVTNSPPSGSYSTADLHAAGNDAILSMVHQTGGFSSPKHLVTQKFNSAGGTLWGASPVAVFDGGSLQFGNFPPFVPDGAGGGVYAWYSSSPSLNCFVQRVDSSGTELFPHNGVAVSTDVTRVRTDPKATFDAVAGEIYVFWREQNQAQSLSGVRGQIIDSMGGLKGPLNGATVVAEAVNPDGTIGGTIGLNGGASSGALVIYGWQPAGFGSDQLFAGHMDSLGNVTFSMEPVATTQSGKSRLAVGVSGSGDGFAVLAWSDQRTDGGDIYVQNVNFDGSLGGATGPGTDHCFGDGGDQMGCTDCPCMNNAPMGSGGGCLNSAGSGSKLVASGDTSVSLPMASGLDLRFSATGGPAFQLFILNAGDALAPGDPANPCFGTGSGAGGAAFDGLRCAIVNTQRNGGRGADSNGEVGATNAAWGGSDNPPGGIAQFFGYVSGQTRFFQGIHRDDPAVNCGTGLNTTQAIEVTFTP